MRNSRRTCRYEVKCCKAFWLQAREALWSNYKRTQSSESSFFLFRNMNCCFARCAAGVVGELMKWWKRSACGVVGVFRYYFHCCWWWFWWYSWRYNGILVKYSAVSVVKSLVVVPPFSWCQCCFVDDVEVVITFAGTIDGKYQPDGVLGYIGDDYILQPLQGEATINFTIPQSPIKTGEN